MKKLLYGLIIGIIILSVLFAFAGCKGKMPPINTDFKDVPEDAVIASGLSALELFNEAITNTYSDNYKRVNVLDFYTNALLGQKQDEVASFYRLDDTYMRISVVKGEGNIAKDNTAIKVFYNDGDTAKIAEESGKKLQIDFDNVDYAQIADKVANCTDASDRIVDYNKFTSYIRTTEKLSTAHNDEVYTKGNMYYATIKFKMNVGTVNSGIQSAVDRAVEGGTGADKNSINWIEDTVWNCIFQKIGDKFYLKKTYLYENYSGKQKGIVTATCTQSNVSEFWYGEDIIMPQAVLELLGY